MPRPEILTALGMTPGEWASKSEKEREVLRAKAQRILNGEEEPVTRENPLSHDLNAERLETIQRDQQRAFAALDERFTAIEERLKALEKASSEKPPEPRGKRR